MYSMCGFRMWTAASTKRWSCGLARHPSESAEYLVTRLLAYCLEYTEGIAFSKGLSDPDEPAIVVRDLTGALRGWIEVGAPEAARCTRGRRRRGMWRFIRRGMWGRGWRAGWRAHSSGGADCGAGD